MFVLHTNVRKNFVPTKFWQIFKLSPPITMVGAETMFYWNGYINNCSIKPPIALLYYLFIKLQYVERKYIC